MAQICEVCVHLPEAHRTKDPSRRPRPLILQDRIVRLCDPHAERVIDAGAETHEKVHSLFGSLVDFDASVQ
jgi:hypothetical protein